jgi:hypothetical protein
VGNIFLLLEGGLHLTNCADEAYVIDRVCCKEVELSPDKLK